MTCKGVSPFEGLEEAREYQKGTSTVYLLLWDKQLVSSIYRSFILFMKHYCDV